MIAATFTPVHKQLTLATSPESIYAVEAAVEELQSLLDIRDDVYANIMVAVTEAVANAVFHGNKEDAGKQVFVTFAAKTPYRLVARVKDEGTGFNPDSLPDPTAPENIEKLSGRGVFLMRQLADETAYFDEGREVELAFNV
jgi:serine/threonine-protein kinase RsbW